MKNFNHHKEDDLNAWNGIKTLLHHIRRIPNFSEGEIWWCSCGENIGVEINGKNKELTRPVLIYHKYNKLSFLGIPLTSQEHSRSWYVPFRFQNKTSYAVLCQNRAFDAKRLHGRMGEIAEDDYKRIMKALLELYSK